MLVEKSIKLIDFHYAWDKWHLAWTGLKTGTTVGQRGNTKEIAKQEMLEDSFWSYISVKLVFILNEALGVIFRKTSCAYFPWLPETKGGGITECWNLDATNWKMQTLLNHGSSKRFYCLQDWPSLTYNNQFWSHKHTHTHTHCTTTPLLVWLLLDP